MNTKFLTVTILMFDLLFVTYAIELDIDGYIDIEPEWLFDENEIDVDVTNNKKLVKVDFPQKVENENDKHMTEQTNIQDCNNALDDATSNSKLQNEEGKKNNPKSTKLNMIDIYEHTPNTKQEFETTNKPFNSDKGYLKPYKVKENKKLLDFSTHIYKQNIRVFINMKKVVNDTKMKKEIDFAISSYKEKFSYFVKHTRNQKIKTVSGLQKVVMNTIETSNRIMRRLVNYLTGDMEKQQKKGNLRYVGVANILEKQVDSEVELEHLYACRKFGICRSTSGFGQFATDVFKTVASTNHFDIVKFNTAFINTLRKQDFSKIAGEEINHKLHEQIKLSDKILREGSIQPLYQIFRNLMVSRNRPLIVPGENNVKSSLALLDLFDILDEKIPPTEENKMEWTEMKIIVHEWAQGLRSDIKDIVEMIVSHVFEKSLKMDYDTAKSVQRSLAKIV